MHVSKLFKDRVKEVEGKQQNSWINKHKRSDVEEVTEGQAIMALEQFASGNDISANLSLLAAYFHTHDDLSPITSNIITSLIQCMREIASNPENTCRAVELLGALWESCTPKHGLLFDQELIDTVLNCGLYSKNNTIEAAAFRALLVLCTTNFPALEFLCSDSVMAKIDEQVFSCPPESVTSDCVQGCLYLLNNLLDVQGNDEIYWRFVERITNLVINCPDVAVASIAPLTLSKLMERFFSRVQLAEGWNAAKANIVRRFLTSDQFDYSMNMYTLLAGLRILGGSDEIYGRVKQDIQNAAETPAPALFEYIRMCFHVQPSESLKHGLAAALLGASDAMCYDNKRLAGFAVIEMLSSESCEEAVVREMLGSGAGQLICDVGVSLDVVSASCFMEAFTTTFVRDVFVPLFVELRDDGVLDYLTELASDSESDDFAELVSAFRMQVNMVLRASS